MKRFVIVILAVVFLFSIVSVTNASDLQSVYKIGVAQFTNSSAFANAPEFFADTFVNELPRSLNVKALKIKEDIEFSNKDNIIQVGSQHSVDAILTGFISEYTVKQDLIFGGIYSKVRVSATMYDAKTGEVLWTGTITERYRGNTEIHCLQRASRGTVIALKNSMIKAGLQGRPADNEKPVIDVADSNFSLTSVLFLDGFVKDNFGINRLLINGQPTTVNNEGRFTYMVPVNNPPVSVDIKVDDDAGNVTTKTVQILKTGALKGSIAQIIGNKILINKGSMDGMKEGMGFTVSTVRQIKDPATGQILDSVATDIGIIKIVEVRDKLSIAVLVSVLNEGKVSIGDTIY